MPVLPPEVSLLPDDLFTGEISVMEPAEWWVLHTKPRAEKAVARLLASRRISFFLPLYSQKKRIQRRTVISLLPLFPGYVFLRGGSEARVAALETNRIANCLPVPDQDTMQRDLRRIHASIESGTPLLPEERIQPGTPAEIVCGPLAGHRGVVVQSGKRLKFVMEINFLQRGASIEVEASMIRPV